MTHGGILRPLLVSTSDTRGGAARAAYRLHRALREDGADSQMLVGRRESDDPAVSEAGGRAMFRVRAALERNFDSRARRRDPSLFQTGWLPTGMARRLAAWNDRTLLHLHWINAAFLRAEDLARERRPVVWTLHDFWPFTGGCHYDEGCGRHIAGCGQCPMLRTRGRDDASARLVRRKLAAWRALDLTLIAPSQWIAEQASRSAVMAGRQVHVIPNALDLGRFRPDDRQWGLRYFDLPDDGRKTLLLGATSPFGDRRKGGELAIAALKRLAEAGMADRLRLILLGDASDDIVGPGDIPVHALGYLDDDRALRAAYSAADLTLLPSRQENLANVVAESLACGRPCVGFDIGGNGDLIRTGETGALARPFDIADFADAIGHVLSRDDWTARCRAHAERTVAEPLIAARHRDLYESLLARDPVPAVGR